MEGSILSYVVGVLGIVFLILVWILVQSVWRKFFRDYISDPDVLAGRRSCGNCGCTTACSRKEINESTIS